ncbi:unnamed protein product [Heligmosomoides polygyrus]|uniref:Uncharacterized protein n=1 Tax=Heligmosomoides polygyrus TaxID=6339 RepID=A0A183FJQ0_HELPZ|nr:unnamed protein product [Heligmosomoides polygyrus]
MINDCRGVDSEAKKVIRRKRQLTSHLEAKPSPISSSGLSQNNNQPDNNSDESTKRRMMTLAPEDAA